MKQKAAKGSHEAKRSGKPKLTKVCMCVASLILTLQELSIVINKGWSNGKGVILKTKGCFICKM